MTKQIPESKIVINPVVIDDSKRGLPPENNVPTDMDALLAWLKKEALTAHNANVRFKNVHLLAEEKAYNRVIAKIENSRVNQRSHVPWGWDYV